MPAACASPPDDGGSLPATLAVCAALVVLALAASWPATGGLQHWTWESARRARVSAGRVAAPPLVLRDAGGRPLAPWGPPVGEGGAAVWVVDFVYTRCPTVCASLGGTFQRLQAALPDDGRVALLSISIDPARDDTAALADHARRHGAHAPGWHVTAPADGRDLAGLLRALGVVVLDDGAGGFVHNGALHLVDRAGRVHAVYDERDADEALRHARRLAATVP